MKLQDFINKYQGKFVNFDTAYPNQCVDLSKQWEYDNGWPIITGNACKEPDNADKNFYTWISNTPTGIPKEGDLIIWNCSVGNGSGHIAIFIEGDANSFRSFDQNYPTGTPAHIQNHTYKNILGWLSPNVLHQPEGAQMTIDLTKSILIRRDGRAGVYAITPLTDPKQFADFKKSEKDVLVYWSEPYFANTDHKEVISGIHIVNSAMYEMLDGQWDKIQPAISEQYISKEAHDAILKKSVLDAVSIATKDLTDYCQTKIKDLMTKEEALKQCPTSELDFWGHIKAAFGILGKLK